MSRPLRSLGVPKMCDIDWDGDRWSWFRQTPRTAKKEHRCGACGLPIRPGEPYLDHRHIDGDGISASKACAPCGITLVVFGDAHRFYTAPECIEEFIRDCVINEDEGKGGWRDDLAGIIRRRRAASRALSRSEGVGHG